MSIFSLISPSIPYVLKGVKICIHFNNNMASSSTITTVWSDATARTVEVRHTRRIEAAVTLCGLGTEHTRNFVKGNQRLDERCGTCEQAQDLEAALKAAGA